MALGDLTAMTASMLGLEAVLATSALVFTGLRWLGEAYLIYAASGGFGKPSQISSRWRNTRASLSRIA